LVYGLHPLMPIEYVMSSFNGDHKDVNHVRVLTNKLIELEKLQATTWQGDYWGSTVELCYMELIKVFRKAIQVWISCTLVSKRTKNMYW